jgi:hypothetical protein
MGVNPSKEDAGEKGIRGKPLAGKIYHASFE